MGMLISDSHQPEPVILAPDRSAPAGIESGLGRDGIRSLISTRCGNSIRDPELEGFWGIPRVSLES